MSEVQRMMLLLCLALLSSLGMFGCSEDTAPESPDSCELIATRYRAARARADESCRQDSDCRVYIEFPMRSDHEEGAMGARYSCQPRSLASNVDALTSLSEEARAAGCVTPLRDTMMERRLCRLDEFEGMCVEGLCVAGSIRGY